jgi:hypothetical protein
MYNLQGALLERFEGVLHKEQRQETQKKYLYPATVDPLDPVGNGFPPLFSHQGPVTQFEVRDFKSLT